MIQRFVKYSIPIAMIILMTACSTGNEDYVVEGEKLVSTVRGYDKSKDCVKIDSGSVSGDAVRTDYGLLLRRGDRLVLDDSGSERVLAGGIEKVFAINKVLGGVGVVYGEVGDEGEGELVELVFNLSGTLSKKSIGPYKAPEFVVIGVSLSNNSWLITSLSDLTELIEIIPVGGGLSTLVEPYEYNKEPFMHMSFPRYVGEEMLVLEEFKAQTDINSVATGWFVSRVDYKGLTLERVEWPSDLGLPTGEFDYVRSDEALMIYVATKKGGAGVIIDNGEISFESVCTPLKGRWLDRRS
ncbi:MAG: hypothetical protein ACKOW9_02240 [Candidatus Paceibacterota bacterium]